MSADDLRTYTLPELISTARTAGYFLRDERVTVSREATADVIDELVRRLETGEVS